MNGSINEFKIIMYRKILTYPQLKPQNIKAHRQTIEPIKKVVPVTPQRFRIEDKIEQPTLYLFEAKADQTVDLGGWTGTITAELFSPSGQLLSRLVIHPHQSGRWYGSLSESGLYRVLVYPDMVSTEFIILINLSDV